MRQKIIFKFLALGMLIFLLAACQNRTKLKYDWHQENGYRWSELSIEKGVPGFKKLAASQTGISFVNHLPKEDIFENRNYLNGSGVALGDVDGDGWTDVYFAQLHGPNKLYKNMGGFRFKDITDSAGVALPDVFSTGTAFADIDGDGDLDLLVASMSQENSLFLNDGNGHFTFQKNSGLEPAQGSMSMALADIDGDSDLDLYITNYKRKSVLDLFNVRDLSWEKTVNQAYNPHSSQTYSLRPPYDKEYTIIQNKNKLPDRREIGRQDVLYINTGNGKFQKADPKQRFFDHDGHPVGLQQDFGLSSKFQDINQDGRPDLYVCNDYWTQDKMWLNRGNGTFKAVSPLAMRNMSFASMSTDFGDINRDGYWDFFVTEMLGASHEEKLRQFIPDDPYPLYIGDKKNQPQYNRNSLYINRGDNTFKETSYYSGVEATGWSWASRFLDVDLDGYEDLLITTGYKYDVQDLDAQEIWRSKLAQISENRSFIDVYPSLKSQNKAFRNDRNSRFDDVSTQWGFTEKDISQGLVTADFDHDGDLDVVINRLNDEAAVYENTASAPRIAIRLTGKKPNTQAAGAKISFTGGPVKQTDEIEIAGEYLSSSDPLIVFAADKKNSNHTLTITWPDGTVSRMDSLRANRIYEINENSVVKGAPLDFQETSPTIFKDVSKKIDHIHHEEPYNDFRVQALLPIKLSREGPGISWIDVDDDGDDDLIIPTGRGGRLAVYENKNGNFTARPLSKISQLSRADQTTVLGWKQDNQTKLLVGNANYEPGDITFPSVRNFSLKDGKVVGQDSISGVFSTTGPLAAADYDGDGDLDLFVGGRFVPAHYPMNASSRLFINENGSFVLDETNSQKLHQLGLVTGAVFTDYDGDGDADLLCSLEWGTLKLFQNNGSNFQDVTESVGLAKLSGWWNGVATGDFNNDGRPDIIATNWGLNSPYQLDSDHPLKMYYKDFNRNGKVDIIEAYYDDKTGGYVPRRQLKEYKSIANIFAPQINNNMQFARAPLSKILQVDLSRTPLKEINTSKSMIFINGSDGFSAHPLPKEAQLSAAFYAGSADYDNDGNEDLFLSQNFFEVRPNTPRLDAGRGMWLKGDGTGNFKAIPGQQSGIEVYGEQRGAALGDFNADGKVDLAVSQNGAATKLYENHGKKTGITIWLHGPKSNGNAIGSSIRILYKGNRAGPRREIQAGSGYWSQNSATQVLGFTKRPVAIEVHWYDGKIDTIDAKPEKNLYEIYYE